MSITTLFPEYLPHDAAAAISNFAIAIEFLFIRGLKYNKYINIHTAFWFLTVSFSNPNPNPTPDYLIVRTEQEQCHERGVERSFPRSA